MIKKTKELNELIHNKDFQQSILNTENIELSSLSDDELLAIELAMEGILPLMNDYILLINDFDTIMNDKNIESFLENNCPLTDIKSIN